MKICLLDIGNSTVLIAEANQEGFLNKTWVSTTQFIDKFDASFFMNFDSILASSVVPKIDLLFQNLPITFVTFDNVPKLIFNLSEPEQLGADRVVNALGALTHYGPNCLIIDSGTALTFCYVDHQSVYQGGIIFPGPTLATLALYEHTAKIPLIYPGFVNKLLGKNTEEAVQIGSGLGYIHLINGFIADFRKTYPQVTVIGTGNGLASIQEHLYLDYHDSELILKGLYASFPF